MSEQAPSIQKGGVYLADLNPRFGTEPGKVRPVVVVQTNLLNGHHPSTLVCPITTKVQPSSKLLRIHLRKGEAGLPELSDVMVDQARAIDNRRLVRYLGAVAPRTRERLFEALVTLLT